MKKKWIIAGLLGVTAFGLYGFASAKKTQAQNAFKNIRITVSNIYGVDISINEGLRLKFDVTLHNDSAYQFSASSGSLITGYGWRISKNEKTIASGQLNQLEGINLPAYGSYTIKGLSFKLPLGSLGEIVTQVLGAGNLLQSGTNLIALFSDQATRNQATQDIVSNAKKLINGSVVNIDFSVLKQMFSFKKELNFL